MIRDVTARFALYSRFCSLLLSRLICFVVMHSFFTCPSILDSLLLAMWYLSVRFGMDACLEWDWFRRCRQHYRSVNTVRHKCRKPAEPRSFNRSWKDCWCPRSSASLSAFLSKAACGQHHSSALVRTTVAQRGTAQAQLH